MEACFQYINIKGIVTFFLQFEVYISRFLTVLGGKKTELYPSKQI